MEVEKIVEYLEELNVGFFTGVPDSQLKSLCSYLMHRYGTADKHIIAANEGNAVGLASGYHIATGKIACVYMQNSGLGNAINPIASLTNDKVYAIPTVFIIGWRGEPRVKDEPQHMFQGEITLRLLEDLNIDYIVLDKLTKTEEIEKIIPKFRSIMSSGKSVAFIVKKGALFYDKKVEYKNDHSMNREKAMEHIVMSANKDIIISTTGKVSRELYEIRERNRQEHKYDFLTVGSMGHSSSIALAVALNTHKKVWCLDGDGALLMHMGAMALIGSKKPKNYIHIVFNNAAHESVGGMPTVCNKICIQQIALACGYTKALSVNTIEELERALKEIKACNELCLLEIKIAIGSRNDLGRPLTTPIENKQRFMEYLNC